MSFEFHINGNQTTFFILFVLRSCTFGFADYIYLQTGVIMLIGLLAKTAILITEFAIERRRKGMGIVESAYSAAQARLRPI